MEMKISNGVKKFLYTHPDESIAYIIDKISGTPESDIFLVVDANPEVFSDDLNLKLLKREADNFSKTIIIVSKIPQILDAARQAGFSVSLDDINIEESIGSAPTAENEVVETMRESEVPMFAPESDSNGLPWMKKRAAEEVSEIENDEIGEEREIEARIRSGPGISKKFFSWKFILAILAAVVVMAVAGFYFLSPKVMLSLVFKKTTLNLDFKVTADVSAAAVDMKSAKIPGQLVKLEKELSDQFAASGKKDSESKAEGEVTIYNEFGASSQKLVKNTRFKSKDGYIFRLKGDISVPGATVVGGSVTSPGVITAAVIADQPGPQYNIEPTDFTIPGFEGTSKFVTFYGKSANPMAGGALSGVAFATKDDLDKAKAALADKFNKSVEELAGTEAAQGMKVLTRARLEPVFNFSAGDPDQSGKFTAHMKVNYGVFAFSESDMNGLIDQYLSGKLSNTQKYNLESRTISYADESLSASNLSMGFTVKVSQLVEGNIDESKIKNDLAGKNEEEMKEVLRANEAIESAEFSFWPIWISVAPRDTDRIKISIQE